MGENDKRALQTRLIDIKNICEDLAVAIEKHLNNPDTETLIVLVKALADSCREYLKALSA